MKIDFFFVAAAMPFNVLFKVGNAKRQIFLRNLNTQNFMILHSSPFHHRSPHDHHIGIIHG